MLFHWAFQFFMPFTIIIGVKQLDPLILKSTRSSLMNDTIMPAFLYIGVINLALIYTITLQQWCKYYWRNRREANEQKATNQNNLKENTDFVGMCLTRILIIVFILYHDVFKFPAVLSFFMYIHSFIERLDQNTTTSAHLLLF